MNEYSVRIRQEMENQNKREIDRPEKKEGNRNARK